MKKQEIIEDLRVKLRKLATLSEEEFEGMPYEWLQTVKSTVSSWVKKVSPEPPVEPPEPKAQYQEPGPTYYPPPTPGYVRWEDDMGYTDSARSTDGEYDWSRSDMTK